MQARVQGGGLLGAHGAAGPAASGRGRGPRRGRDRARPDARRVRREGRRGVPSVEHRSGKLNLLHLLLPLFDGFFVYFKGTLAGILVVVVLGGVTIAIMLYYRFHRRLKRLKTELAHVHYIADPGTQPG